MTLDDDLRVHEEHARLLEIAKAANPRIAKIQAKRDIKVARARSMSEDTRLARIIAPCMALVAVVAIGSMASCTVIDNQPDPVGDQIRQEKFELCIDAGGDWDEGFEDCDLPGNED